MEDEEIEYIEIGEDVFIAEKLDREGKALIGIYLPFGNAEATAITRDEALSIVTHLKKIFNLPG